MANFHTELVNRVQLMLSEGLSPAEMAARMSMSIIDLQRVVRGLIDTRPQAKAALAGAALDMAHSVIECDDPKVHLAALKGLRVIDETEGSGLTIIVGAGGAVQVNIGAKGPSEP